MLPDVDIASSGFPVLYKASLKPMSSKLLFRLQVMRRSVVPLSWSQMYLTVPMWTGPKRSQEERVDVFAAHHVVRRVAADSLARQVV